MVLMRGKQRLGGCGTVALLRMSQAFIGARNEHFTGNIVKQTEEKPCPCGQEMCRPGQRNGPKCHALAQSVYRARVKHQAEKNEKIFFKLLAERSSTCTSSGNDR